MDRRTAILNALATAAAVALAPAIAEASESDAELLRLEERIFEERAAVDEHEDEIRTLAEIFNAEFERGLEELQATGAILTRNQTRRVWDQARRTPAAAEQVQLEGLRDQRLEQMNALIEKMWRMPARTPEGRRAKLLVLLGCVLEERWRHHDEAADWDVKIGRDLLIEFVGGEPAKQLRDQFS